MTRFVRFVRYKSGANPEPAAFLPTKGRDAHLQASDLKRHLALLGAACFAMVWAIARAGLQSVTLDEAASYLTFAAPDWPAYWYASSGNHVLNTILERIFSTAFGLSHLTLRAP